VTVVGQIVVPALALRARDSDRLDAEATARYARRAAGTWADAFILSGSTTRGDQLTVEERAELLDLWSGLVPASRLVACCWCEEDIQEAKRHAITPMIVMHSPRNDDQALLLLARLPLEAYVYSHPKYGSTVLNASLTAAARQRGILPAGAKLSKITAENITAIRQAAGSLWTLWDASARHIHASLAAGASGVVATPLSHFPTPFPDRSLPILQAAIDAMQKQLDRLPSRTTRSQLLHGLANENTA
jgi:dihydrodipicolinate synthase/N-acetylneuraminate lyase